MGGKEETGKWGNVVFVQIETAEVYFPTQRYISRPQRWIFKLRPLVISHTSLAPATFTVGFIGTVSKQENGDENEKKKNSLGKGHWSLPNYSTLDTRFLSQRGRDEFDG